VTRPALRPDQPSIRIAGELRSRIVSGELAPGDRLPSTRQITRDWGVAMATATKVLTMLRQEGLVRAVPGVGTVVASAGPPASDPMAPGVARVPDAQTPPVRRSRTLEVPLSRDRIVVTAMRIADGQGMGELSMRRVATELGVATMALYRYVPSKDDLITLMIDEVFAAMPVPTPPPDASWRERLELLCRLQWSGYQQHPWLAAVLSFSRPQLIPRGMQHTEFAMASVNGLGLDAAERLHVAVMLALHVRGAAMAVYEELHAQQETGLTADEWMLSQEGFYQNVMDTERFPMMAAVASIEEDAINLESLFEFGLARILDGVAALIASRG
jgi:AcrR family transcriptional regulator